MKKKLVAILLCMTCVLSFAGCGNKKSTKTEAKITLGQYKGLNVQESTYEITDEELQDYIDYICERSSYTEAVEEGTLEEDMSVKIDYVSTIDGEEYTGGTQTGAVITLADGGFKVDGVIEALIGKNVGDVVEVDTKYDDDYSDSTLAGKDVHFEVTIKSIQKTVVPEYTDEFVEENFSYLGYKTTEEFNEYLRDDLRLTAVINEIWETVVDNATVESYDSDELSELTDSYVEYQESIIYYYYGYELDAYLAAINQSMEEFENEQREYAKEDLKEKMVINAIAEAENITISDEEYKKNLELYAANYGYDTVEEFSSAYSSYQKSDFEYSMIIEEVQKLICDSAVTVEDYSTTEAETSDGETDSASEEDTTEEETAATE